VSEDRSRGTRPVRAKIAASTDSVQPESRGAWRAWLAEHHASRAGVWLVTWKVVSGKPRITYDEAVEEAVCFGWIDSKPRALDAERSMLWFAPRKPGTGWSRPNKLRAQRAIAGGQMTAAGLLKINRAKADGSWVALDAVENLDIPDDLAAALRETANAAENFERFPRSVKRNILEWISIAKTAGTRSARILETAQRAAVNERANQWRR
jgi:uncharacterized protein YdeI (YjbR/CyaY-like superfamily)